MGNNINNWKEFGITNFKDLDDIWLPSYHLSQEIKDVKRDYKKLGKENFINKICTIVNKIGEETYSILRRESKNNFDVSLPFFKSAKSPKYWRSHYNNISKIIIAMEVLTKGIDREKVNIEKKIQNLQKRLNNINNIK